MDMEPLFYSYVYYKRHNYIGSEQTIGIKGTIIPLFAIHYGIFSAMSV